MTENKGFKKIYNYISENKIYLLILLIGFLILLLQMKNVIMYADDYALKIVSNKGWKYILSYQYNHYFNWGGGFTPILVTSLLRFDFGIWKLLIISLIMLTISYSVKMIDIHNQKEKSMVALILLDCFLFVSIVVTRETVYWLDGSMAYMFTTFQVFLYIYYFYTRVYKNIHKKYDYILMPLVSFFAGWSSAQSGAMALIIPTIMVVYSYVFKKNKVNKFYHFVNILGIIGFAIFYFAPGNSARMGVMGLFTQLNFIEKITYRVGSIFTYMFGFNSVQFNTFPFFILLSWAMVAIYGIHELSMNFKKSNWLLKLSVLYLVIILISYLCIKIDIPGFSNLSGYLIEFRNIYENGISLSILIPYAINVLAVLCSIYISFYIAKKENEDSIAFLPLITYGSQAVMVMAPYSEYRTELISLVFLWIYIAYLFLLLYRKKNKGLSLLYVPFIMFNINISIIILLFLFIKLNMMTVKKKIIIFDYACILLVFTLLSFVMGIETYNKYRINKKIDDKNIAIIKQSLNNDEIYLYKPDYVYYGFGDIIDNAFAADSVKELYGLKSDVKFIEIKEEVNYEKN